MSQPKGGWLTAKELAGYKLDLVGVQEVRWDRGGTVRAGDYNFFYGNGNKIINLGTEFFVHHRLVSAVKKVGCMGRFVNNTTFRFLFLSLSLSLSLYIYI
jgi:hypothetical protein